jgi:hypothetical protein
MTTDTRPQATGAEETNTSRWIACWHKSTYDGTVANWIRIPCTIRTTHRGGECAHQGSAIMGDETNQFEWVEPLPDGCPPPDAERPNYTEFYRLVKTIPAEDDDFVSFRERNPDRPLKYDECIERSCSLFNTYQQCNRRRKSRIHRAKKIVRIMLTPESGLILRTLNQRGHHSWWRAKGFHPVEHCQEAEPPSV